MLLSYNLPIYYIYLPVSKTDCHPCLLLLSYFQWHLITEGQGYPHLLGNTNNETLIGKTI